MGGEGEGKTTIIIARSPEKKKKTYAESILTRQAQGLPASHKPLAGGGHKVAPFLFLQKVKFLRFMQSSKRSSFLANVDFISIM